MDLTSGNNKFVTEYWKKKITFCKTLNHTITGGTCTHLKKMSDLLFMEGNTASSNFPKPFIIIISIRSGMSLAAQLYT